MSEHPDKLTVVFDNDGRILAISKQDGPGQSDPAARRLVIRPRPGQRILACDVEAAMAGKSLKDIHNEYTIDVTNPRLVRKQSGG